jgi:hypothetical protein
MAINSQNSWRTQHRARHMKALILVWRVLLATGHAQDAECSGVKCQHEHVLGACWAPRHAVERLLIFLFVQAHQDLPA